jgi:MoaA/NifB/PqqE/SkfB family radical SAM enzyme
MKGPEGKIPGGDLIDTDLIIRVLKEFSLTAVNSVTWTGGGEPTLHPDFEAITGYVYKEGIEQGMYTHGGHINRERAEHIKMGFKWVYISLDADNAFDYKRLKGVDKFSDALKGIEYLSRAPGDAVVGVGFLLTRSNFYSIAGMVELAKRMGANYCQFRPTIRYETVNPGKVAENTAWIHQAILALTPYVEDPFVSVDLDRFRQYVEWDGHGYAKCWWTGLQAVITPNGKVWTCINKREFPGAELGDLNDDSFGDIWARHGLHSVNGSCRAMCRGHLPNLTLEQVLTTPEHENFI